MWLYDDRHLARQFFFLFFRSLFSSFFLPFDSFCDVLHSALSTSTRKYFIFLWISLYFLCQWHHTHWYNFRRQPFLIGINVICCLSFSVAPFDCSCRSSYLSVECAIQLELSPIVSVSTIIFSNGWQSIELKPIFISLSACPLSYAAYLRRAQHEQRCETK